MTTTEPNTEWAAKRDDWERKYLRPASERPQSTARGLHRAEGATEGRNGERGISPLSITFNASDCTAD